MQDIELTSQFQLNTSTSTSSSSLVLPLFPFLLSTIYVSLSPPANYTHLTCFASQTIPGSQTGTVIFSKFSKLQFHETKIVTLVTPQQVCQLLKISKTSIECMWLFCSTRHHSRLRIPFTCLQKSIYQSPITTRDPLKYVCLVISHRILTHNHSVFYPIRDTG